MSELKLVVENDADNPLTTKSDVSALNPFDALNRRDIELIKRSLVSMHKDSADLRTTIIALHERNSHVPSKSFFFGLGLIGLIGFGALTVARPQLEAALRHIPALSKAMPVASR